MCCYVRDMYDDKSELREFNVDEKLLVCSLHSLLEIVTPHHCVGYACSTIFRLAQSTGLDS